MEYMLTLTPLAPPQLMGIYGSPISRGLGSVNSKVHRRSLRSTFSGAEKAGLNEHPSGGGGELVRRWNSRNRRYVIYSSSEVWEFTYHVPGALKTKP